MRRAGVLDGEPLGFRTHLRGVAHEFGVPKPMTARPSRLDGHVVQPGSRSALRAATR
ncbi:hypothetical protein M2164_007759 [Streptomyces sp. SAI-208]|uniref:hypothetical protein n=1 Tax=Streptomyces sp. SAI-208 TaxID=2940550 RepID=UPI002474662E|nr:hypothetical protein [Streptomyces sp. SAI-208]MDH6612124.1 hypothetical protein [Streptomyces sp. SAI-208]